MWKQVQENLVNRLVDSGFESLSGKHNSDSDLENMESNFNSLMARAHDLLREIRTKEQQGRKRKREVEVWFQDVENVKEKYHAFINEEKGLMKQIFGGDEAIKLNARIRDLDDRSRHFGELADDNTCRGLPRPTSGLEGAAFLDNFQKILDHLKNGVRRIGVFGMGGVGKSTLVEHIYNQLLDNNECVYWVVVSQGCSIKMLQDKIAHKLNPKISLDKDDDEGARAGRLNQALSQEKDFVLILDDVWESFDLKKVGLPLSIPGCKWMITSRSLKVCREMNCQEKIAVKPLSEGEGWNLFLENLGEDATSALKDPEVERTAKSLVGICDGLPLGIITLAGALSGATEVQEWRHALGVLKESAMGHEFMEEKVFPVLKYSFDRLSPNDKRCFLYCSLYPEDYQIDREELLDNLISERLVDEKKSRAAQRDEVHSIVNRLVKVSLLESVSDHSVKMHDLVRGMAHKITIGKVMVIAGHYNNLKEIPTEEEWTKDLEKVSLMINGIDEIPHGISPNCPKLTTLLLQHSSLNRIATSFFWQVCGLRTLNLSDTSIQELPDSVSDLVNLTSLLLGRCTELRYVPCVRKLKELRELDLSFTAIEDVPEGLEELIRLRLLRLPNNKEVVLVEGGWERLEVFEGRLKHVADFNRLFASKQDAVSYAIAVGDYNFYMNEEFEFDSGRRELYAYDLKGSEGNELTTIVADYIQYMEFDFCEDMSKCLLDDVTNPASLKKLNISDCRGIECILTNDQFKAPQFLALEEIELYYLEDFMGVIHKLEIQLDPPPPSSPFPSLINLDISGCHKMKKLGLPLWVFEKLEHIDIEDCKELEEIIQVDDDSLHISLTNLKRLFLTSLPSLKCFGRAPVICNLLENFILVDCPRLEAPFVYWGTPHSNYNPLFPGRGVEEIRRQSL